MPQKISNCSIYLKERKSNFNIFINRVEYLKDEKFADSGIFTILLEDHTLGNLVKM